MKQIVHETDKIAISTVRLTSEVDLFDGLLGFNPDHLPYESMVFPLVDGRPDFSAPIETKSYGTQAEAEAGHQALIIKYDPK